MSVTNSTGIRFRWPISLSKSLTVTLPAHPHTQYPYGLLYYFISIITARIIFNSKEYKFKIKKWSIFAHSVFMIFYIFVFGHLSFTFCFYTPQQFYIIFKSGDNLGQFMTCTLAFSSKEFMLYLEVSQTPSVLLENGQNLIYLRYAFIDDTLIFFLIFICIAKNN